MISKLTIGTAQFGLNYGVANKIGKIKYSEAKEIINYAEKNNIKTIDTASAYGESEKLLGQIGVSDFDVITKLPKIVNPIKNFENWFKDSLNLSLQRLKINKLSTIMIHNSDDLFGENGKSLIKFLYQAKEDSIVDNIGISIYSPNEINKILNMFNFDVIQAPLNPFDNRIVTSGWMDELYKRNIKVHIRSIFLQGLLLIPYEKIPKYFYKFKSNLKQWHDWNINNNFTSIETCIGFINSFERIEKIIVGIDNLNQLQEIIKLINIRDNKFKNMDLESNDINLIDPSRWSL